MSRGLQLLLLSCACSLASAARMEVACWDHVDLPCPAPWDPQVSYTVSWAKLTERGEESLEVLGEEPSLREQSSWQKEQNGSAGAPGGNPHSLRIQNATSCHTGTYRCTLWDPEGQRNRSGAVDLRVTGCRKECKEENFKKYRAEMALLLALVVFYLTLIIFTCKFARLQSIFPDFSKPIIERTFLPVTSPGKHLGPVTLHKTELV
ncbi:CD83 antigen [Dasypus novemcinctus]|uniref:CD83 antigen n=1 Tax=Dasypus novemcinctus TaxID=9361 RepID=UPI000329337C|nr:CD83 antigen [Dasypus novemcinctus]